MEAEGVDLRPEECAEIDAAHRALASATHYQVLGVAPDATPEAVREAYLDRTRRFHPEVTRAAGSGRGRHGWRPSTPRW